jgi:hypothetical protein
MSTTLKALKGELVRAFSLLCTDCYKRDELCDGSSEKQALKWLKSRGWQIINDEAYCSECAKAKLKTL